MIVFVAALLGAVIGGLRARRRKGRPADIAQYAFVYAVFFALAALFVTIIIQRATL